MTAASYSLSVTVTDTLRSLSSCPAALEATTHIDLSEDSTSVYRWGRIERSISARENGKKSKSESKDRLEVKGR